MLRTYKYRLYPTPDQEVLLAKHFGCVRWVYNWALAEKASRYSEEGKSVSIYDLQSYLPELKEREETKWLSEVSAASLQSALHNLDDAFTAFFNKRKRGCFPRFKSRNDNHQSFQLPQDTRVDFGTQMIHLRKFTEGIKACLSRRFDGKVKTTAVKRVPSGKYYAFVLVETPETEPPLLPTAEATALGLDFGLKDLVVTSDGQRFVNPRTLKRYLRRLKLRGQQHSRTQKGSKRREKARLRLALTHERISNIRNDNLHKISSKLVYESQGVSTLCVEDLNVTGMMANRRLARSIADAGWRELRRQLEYKCRWAGKNLRVIGRFEPSSKMCSECGHIHKTLTLKDREWTCTSCGGSHDRDVNAAINIRRMAFRSQNTYSDPTQFGMATSRGGTTVPKYRQVRRKSKPVEQPIMAATKRECEVLIQD